MYDRIEESISAALSEDINEDYFNKNSSNKHKTRSSSNSNRSITTEKFLEICLDVNGGVNDPKWDNVRTVLKYMDKKNNNSNSSNKSNQIDLITGIGSYSNIPLHLICFKDPPIDIIQKLISLNPKSVVIPDKEGDLPLHFACLSNSSYEVIKLLVDTYPEGRNIQGELGNTPLHCVLLQEYYDVLLCPEMEDIIQVLLTDEVIHIKDHGGYIPLELFAFRSQQQQQRHNNSDNINHNDNINNNLDDATSKIAKLLIESYPKEYHKSLMKSALTLPTNIQNEIISNNNYFHKCMDRSIMTRFITLCNFYMLYINIFVIVSFTSIVTSLSSSSSSSNNDSTTNIDLKWETFGLRIGILSWIISILIQLLSSLYNKTNIYTSFIINVPILIDILSIFFLFHSMFIFQDTFFKETNMNISWLSSNNITSNKESNTIVLIVTTAIIWIRLFIFVCTRNYSLSLFLSRTVHVITKLVPFFVTIGVLLSAFALMYHIDAVNNNTSCSNQEDDDSLSFCTIQQSYMRLFSMIINRSIDYPESLFSIPSSSSSNDSGGTSTTTLWLTICFSISILFILMNLLIASIIESYYIYLKGDRQTNNKYYWFDRYKQIQDMLFLQQIISLPTTLYYKCRHRSVDTDENDISFTQLNGDYAYSEKDALLWNYTWKVLSTENNSRELSSSEDNNDNDVDTNWVWDSFKSSSIVQFFTKIIALIFVIVWLILGLVTFGLVLPPQVRNWIISSNDEYNYIYSNGINNANNTSSWKFTEIDNSQTTTTNTSSSNIEQENNNNRKNNKIEEKLFYNMNKMEKQQRELILKYDQVVMLLHDMNDNIVNSSNNNTVVDKIASAATSKSIVKSKRDVISASSANDRTTPIIEVCYSENTSII